MADTASGGRGGSRPPRYAPPLVLLALLFGCRDYSVRSGDYANEEPPGDDGASGSDAGDTAAPPESEDDFLSLAPAATDAFVFIANPDRDTVTRISVPSLATITAGVGQAPSVVATAADYSHALTLNEGSDDVSLIDAATMDVRSVEVRPNLNRLELSPDGQWALAWYDPDADSEVAPEGVVSFNEVSLVSVASGAHTAMAVGFNPHGVEWSEDGRLAVIVSDASLAIVDLTAETLAPELVSIADDALDAPPAEEVVLSPDGAWAWVRQFGASELLVVDLVERTVDTVTVGENPTDMDLSPDGAQLSVVARGAQQLWRLDAADPWADPEVLDLPAAYGSLLYADAGQAVLYTNATALTTFALWDTTTSELRERSLVKPVESVGVSPTGGSLLIFHTLEDADGADTESPFYRHHALTLIDLDDLRTNPLVLDDAPSGYATSDDGRWGYFMMEGLPYLEVLDFETLLYDEVPIPSEPVFLGVLPGSDTAWVSQDHDLGRISFYEPTEGSLDTITGFELNAEIEHE